jgi:hypothetical protein
VGTLLDDSDTYWQIAVGQRILDQGTLAPRGCLFLQQARRGLDFIVWLAQVLYA